LLDLDSFASFEVDVLIADISEWGIEGLMASALAVIYVFTNHLPIIKVKHLLTEDRVGVKQTIQDESVQKVSQRKLSAWKVVLVSDSHRVCVEGNVSI